MKTVGLKVNRRKMKTLAQLPAEMILFQHQLSSYLKGNTVRPFQQPVSHYLKRKYSVLIFSYTDNR